MEYSVFLRAFEPDDYILINKWRNDPSIQHLVGGHRRFVSSEMEKEWVRSKMLNNSTDIYLAICTNDEEKKMIGYLSINNIDHWNRTANTGGVVIGDKDYRDGIALFEASLLQLTYIFDELNMHKAYGSCLADHTSSRLIGVGLLYTEEGVLRDHKFKNGRYYDEVVSSLLEDEFREARDKGLYSMKSISQRILKAKREQAAKHI